MSDKISMKGLLLFLCCTVIINTFSQTTEIDYGISSELYSAIDLYNNKLYASAQRKFQIVSRKSSSFENIKSEADFYDALCAIKLNKGDAENKVIEFVKKHPTSSKKDQAYLHVGNYYFVHQKAAHALKWYKEVDSEILSREEQDELNYKMGYAMLSTGYWDDSKEKFNTLLSNPKYGDDARYYYGYISYKQENYGEAEDNLSHLADNATYKGTATYYLLDISFKTGKFEKAVKIGEEILPQAKKEHISDINKIVGESYFNLGKYKEAIPYLLEYKGKNGKWYNTDYYYLGYAYYKQQDYTNAITYFSKIIDGQNKVAQNAYYHLADCYLKDNKKVEALNAFKNASEMNFDPNIQSDAAFNYAKLSYEEGNAYKNVSDVLKEYMAKYPNSPHQSEIRQLIITSYLHQQDYQGALNYLSTNVNPENNKLAHEVSLYRGMQLFNENKFKEANPHFLIAADAENKIVKERAKYWMAEADYRLSNYKNSLDEYLSVENSIIQDANDVEYQIAYSYFKLKNYSKAGAYFKKFLEKKLDNFDLNDDAAVRLGDCYYATKKYNDAILTYSKIINEGGNSADYAQFQKAICLGLIGKNKEKISTLNSLVADYTTSSINDDALFELAKTYTTVKNHSKAHSTYQNLVIKHPTSGYVPSSLLREGLLYYTDNKNTKAITKFKEVVSQYPASNEAKQAVSNARKVYIDMGKVNEYASWVKTLKFVNVTNADIDNASYEAVENQFLNNDYTAAIAGFNSYIQKFPQGVHLVKANFYLAEAYVKTKQEDKAILHYDYVIKQNKNQFSEEALSKLSTVYLQKEDWKKVIPILTKLESEANYQYNLTFAQSNLMKAYYLTDDYGEAIKYAEKILMQSKVQKNVEQDAQIILARSAFKKDDYETAQEYFSQVEQSAQGELKAESLYYKAYFLNVDKIYNESNEVVQKLIADYSAYKYWGVKGYILMAKNQYALKDAYQATYILENIIKNFSQFPDVIEDAKNELRKIQLKESKTNGSVRQK